jgi:MFS superfamily sulfate permease-like transporter
MRDIARVRGGEFAVALITAATVVIVGVEQAILLAIVLSVIEHLYHAYKPYDTTLAVGPNGLTATPLASGTLVQAAPGLVIYSFGAGLYYANATRFTEEAMRILDTADPPVEWFCLSGAAVGDIDYTGAGAVAEVIAQVKERGAKFVVTDLAPNLLVRAGQYGIEEQVDEQFDSVEDVIEAFKARRSS